MSNANLSALHSRFRRKVTVACDSCRKRRVKCSGSQPCTLCSESGRCCEFDNGSRSRRGPKPRQAARQTQTQRILRPLVPRFPSYDQEDAQPASIEVEDEPSWATREMQAADEPLNLIVDDDSEGEIGHDGNDDCGSSTDGSSTPDPLQWKSGLECIFFEDDSIADVLPSLDVYTICHLLEIFTLLASAQLRTLLPTVEIHSHLSSGTMPRCLILAACASAVRFSVHKAINGPSARQFADSIAREARNCIRISNDATTQVNTIKSTCILVDYSASKAHGRQAWADIAMGQALVQLARLDCKMDAEGEDALNATERYLAAAQLTHCLGHPRLYPPCLRPEGKSKPDAKCANLERGSLDLVNLLEILVRVYQLQSVPVKEQKPPPWAPHSKYRALQNELEEHLLHYPDTFRLFARSRPRDLKEPDIDELISSLMWHCCVVVLNRPFLPILARISEEGRIDQIAKKVYFPGAPHLFVKEKVYRCEASADAIFNISRNIVRANVFHSYATLVGFACTQGALVSINRIHWSSKPHEATSAGNLRMTLTVLEALKTFYTPAEDWINTLAQAHDASMQPALTSDDLDLAFRGYFSRFSDIREPTFVPLDPREKDTPRGAIGTPESVQSQERCLERNSKNSDLPNTTTSDRNLDWLKDYAGHLSGDIEPDSDSDNFDADSHTKAAPSRPTLASATCEENSMLTRNAEQVLDAMIPESGSVESSEHMGAAILTAMSSSMCSPAAQLRQSQPEQLQLEHARGLVQMDMDGGISAPFVHMPSFSEVMGLGLNMAMFPGLDLVVGGPDMSPDVFNHDTQGMAASTFGQYI
ncbi:Filamentous growth regulator 27 [Beauveria bassiana]|nr:Filamentous growth regulator 27 [Beauveria bassiana]